MSDPFKPLTDAEIEDHEKYFSGYTYQELLGTYVKLCAQAREANTLRTQLAESKAYAEGLVLGADSLRLDRDKLALRLVAAERLWRAEREFHRDAFAMSKGEQAPNLQAHMDEHDVAMAGWVALGGKP